MKSWILCAVISLTSSAAWGANNQIAVLDIAGNGIDKDLLPTLTEVLTAEIDNIGLYQVIAGRDIEAMLGFESDRLSMGCDDASCLAEIGGALGVDRMVKPQIGRVGAIYVVNIKVINIKVAKTEGRVYETVSGGDEALLATISRSIKRLLGPKSRTGRLVIAAARAAKRENGPAASAGDIDAADSMPEEAASRDHASSDTAATPDHSTEVAAAPESAAMVSRQMESSGGGVPILPIAVGVAGLAAAGVGVAFGLMAKTSESCAQAVDGCVGSQNAIGAAQTQSLLANVMFGAGGAVVAGAVLLFFLSGDDGDEREGTATSVIPMVGPAALGIAFSKSF